MNLADVVIVGLAGWRLAVMVTAEAGPWAVFEKVRDFMGVEGIIEPGSRAQLFSCSWCMSVWIVPLVAVVWWFAPLLVAVVAAMSITLIADKVR